MTKQNEENQNKETKQEKKQQYKYTLEELLEKCTPENRHDYIDFGREGRELL